MTQTGIRWVRPPEQLARAIELYGERVWVAVAAVAELVAQKMQDSARQNAPWTDRTGNARSGIFGTIEQAARDGVTIYLSHGQTVAYGVWLELSRGGQYAIIMPTIEAHIGEIEGLLQRIFAN